jgi:hypothetical protein
VRGFGAKALRTLGAGVPRCRNARQRTGRRFSFADRRRSLTFGGAERKKELLMSDLYQADTRRIRDAPPTSPTITAMITAKDVRTMMLSRIQAPIANLTALPLYSDAGWIADLDPDAGQLGSIGTVEDV